MAFQIDQLLNPVVTETEGAEETRYLDNGFFNYNFSVEDPFDPPPLLEDRSWDDMYGGFFNISRENTSFQSDDQQERGLETVDYQSAVSGIEAWGQHLIAHSLTSTSMSEPTKSVTLSPNFQRNHIEAEGATHGVCYGSIHHVRVRVTLGDMAEVRTILAKSHESLRISQNPFSLQEEEDHFRFLAFDTEIGILSSHASKRLKEIFKIYPAQFDIYTDPEASIETIEKAKKAKEATIRVDINIYGNADAWSAVGKMLSKKKTYLQRPDNLRTGTFYHNPHIILFDDVKLPVLEVAVPTDIISTSAGAVPLSKEAFKKTISKVYASLTRNDHLSRLQADYRLKTTLLPHQEKALDFMIQRENGPVSEEFSLWKLDDATGSTGYIHAITRARKHQRGDETGGGILADDMGMGKSLSVLGLITKTLDHSHEWQLDPASSVKEKRTSRATLIVVSSALLINNWMNEVLIHVDGSLKTWKYHGQKRSKHNEENMDYDIVLTTYHTLAAELKYHKKRPSLLHGVCWYRVVLDEAHIIRRQATDLNHAASELRARSRWCLTGTPIQNRLEDIGALFAFVRAQPFENMAMFRKFIAIPFDENAAGRESAAERLRMLMDSVCIRRTKDLLGLPRQQEHVVKVKLTPEERTQYDRTKRNFQRAMSQKAGDLWKKSSFGMFQTQLQLRIFCNHGTFQHPFSWARARNILEEKEDALCSIGSSGEVKCSACEQLMPILSSNGVYQNFGGDCAHVLCSDCVEGSGEEEGGTSGCPLCFQTMSFHGTKSTSRTTSGAASQSNDNDQYFRREGYSSKMNALMSDLRHTSDGSKSIIFSCWTRTLDLISFFLRSHNIPFERIDGECPLSRRQQILDDFSTRPDIPVLIMSTGTGAFGLNLTAASRVFIVEPQWNPSVENQAISRALRIGQEQNVSVIRYVTENTVEQEMQAIQQNKLELAAMGDRNESGNVSTV